MITDAAEKIFNYADSGEIRFQKKAAKSLSLGENSKRALKKYLLKKVQLSTKIGPSKARLY